MRKYGVKLGGKYIVLILSLLGVLFLYCLSTLSQPPYIALQDIADYDGKQVIIQGVVTAHRPTTYGGEIITLTDFNSTNNECSITVFSEEATSLSYGDTVQVTGNVQQYKGDYELVIDKAQNIQILHKGSNLTFPLAQIAATPMRYEGLNVTVKGVVDRLSSDYFYLFDEDAKYSIIVLFNPAHLQNLSRKDTVLTTGTFLYDLENLRYVLQAQDTSQAIQILERG